MNDTDKQTHQANMERQEDDVNFLLADLEYYASHDMSPFFVEQATFSCQIEQNLTSA